MLLGVSDEVEAVLEQRSQHGEHGLRPAFEIRRHVGVSAGEHVEAIGAHPVRPADDLIVPLDPGESVGATDQVAQCHPQNDQAPSRAHLKLGNADIRR
jgi:hypothetical protein